MRWQEKEKKHDINLGNYNDFLGIFPTILLRIVLRMLEFSYFFFHLLSLTKTRIQKIFAVLFFTKRDNKLAFHVKKNKKNERKKCKAICYDVFKREVLSSTCNQRIYTRVVEATCNALQKKKKTAMRYSTIEISVCILMTTSVALNVYQLRFNDVPNMPNFANKMSAFMCFLLLLLFLFFFSLYFRT